MKQFILNRLKEPSTWRGLVALATAFGAKLSPDQAEAIIIVGIGIIGLVGAFFPDKMEKKVEEKKDEGMDTTGAAGTEQIGADVGP
jgi:hypothetical protein